MVTISSQVPRARAGGGGGQGQLGAGRAAPQLPRGHRQTGEGGHVLYAVDTCYMKWSRGHVHWSRHLVTDRHHRHPPRHPGLRGQCHRVSRIQICLSVSVLQMKCSNALHCITMFSDGTYET